MCVSKMALKECRDDEQVIEFGTGDGSPVIHALESWGRYGGVIHGFEINPSAAAAARNNAAAHGVTNSYKVQNSCFFKGLEQASPSMLIANPPYIAAPDDDILMPALHGGIDGAVLTRTLMSLGLDKAMLLISSYSNPVETLEHARSEGYILRDFMLTSMPFGTYSSEPKVMDWITRMKRESKAFFTSKTYLLAGVLLVKAQAAVKRQDDLTDELLSIMTALH
ncbi:g9917 [Coccomyxa viridis]|uniref:G9917 protein n=1 Tax=Coccomyxa viridis TaxID=1274662 RepID=A0ABP1GB36_9CHLO